MGQAADAVLQGSPLPDDADAYRLLDKPIWMDEEGNVSGLAFQLKPGEGELSLRICGGRTEAQLLKEDPAQRRKCVGVAKSQTGKIRQPIPGWSKPLDVVDDAQDEYHALILGLPLADEDTKHIEDCADEMRTRFVVIERISKSKPH